MILCTIQNLDGATALFAAIFSQNIQSVKLLLDGGADPSQSSNIDSETVTPLHYAAKNGFTGYDIFLTQGSLFHMELMSLIHTE